jgi:hypothetical protein
MDDLLRFFAYEHLPANLQSVSKQFHDLAHNIVDLNPADKREATVALRKLLEAKDAAVRAFL